MFGCDLFESEGGKKNLLNGRKMYIWPQFLQVKRNITDDFACLSSLNQPNFKEIILKDCSAATFQG